MIINVGTRCPWCKNKCLPEAVESCDLSQIRIKYECVTDVTECSMASFSVNHILDFHSFVDAQYLNVKTKEEEE